MAVNVSLLVLTLRSQVSASEYVNKAIDEKEQRMKLYEEKLDEMLGDDVVMIE